jgi:GntR family transcriptional regulator
VEEVVATAARALKHVAVREYVRSLVEDAVAGDPAPSERELVQRFGVARMTVRQAMDALVAEGLLERSPGRGTFVARPRRKVGRLTSFTEDMRQRGLRPDSQSLLLRLEQAGPGVARALGITVGDAVIHWRRLRLGDGEPIALEDVYLNEVLLPGFLHKPTPDSLFAALALRGLRPTWAEDAVSADRATAEEAQQLMIAPASPILRVARRALAEERPVEVSRSAYRADKFTMFVQLGKES